MVIEKKVSKYKRGDSFGYRINIAKTDNFTKDEKIIILKDTEHKALNKKIEKYEETINSLNQELEKTNNELLNHEKTKNNFEDAEKEIKSLNQENGKLMVQITELMEKIANYEVLKKSNKELQQKLIDLKNIKSENNELKDTIANQNLKLNEYKNNDKNLEKIEKIYKETIQKFTQQQEKIIKDLNKQFHDQSKKTNDEFNKKLEKYLKVNIRQNEALKQVINLSFFDLIRNKHKKLANKNIKKLDNTVYELTHKK